MHKLIKRTKISYTSIAKPFSTSRQAIWPEMKYFATSISAGSSVLDLGCGNGRLFGILKQSKLKYLGIDFCEPLLEEARKLYPEAEFKLLDFCLELSNLEQEFDYIVSIAALHHIPKKSLRLKVFKELKGLLKPTGKLLFTVWNLHQPKYYKYLFLSRLKNFFRYGWNDTFIPWQEGNKVVKRYYHAFTKKELASLLKEADFEVEQLEDSENGHNLLVIAGH